MESLQSVVKFIHRFVGTKIIKFINIFLMPKFTNQCKKQLYLHIGLPKTGTTAIQENLFLNRNLLAKSNIFYPALPKRILSFPLLFPFGRNRPWIKGLAEFSHHQIPLNLYKPAIHEIKEYLVSQLKQSRCDNVLISSEAFVFGTEPKDTKDFFADIFENISIILYLRDPLDWLFSDYLQGIKGNRRITETFDTFLQERLKCQSAIDFESVISRWGKEFGVNNITVGLYSKDIQLVDDFLRTSVGLSLHQEWLYPKRKDSNPRLPPEAVEIVRLNNLKTTMTSTKQLKFVKRLALKYTNVTIEKKTLPIIGKGTKGMFQSWVQKNRETIRKCDDNSEFPAFLSYNFTLRQKQT